MGTHLCINSVFHLPQKQSVVVGIVASSHLACARTRGDYAGLSHNRHCRIARPLSTRGSHRRRLTADPSRSTLPVQPGRRNVHSHCLRASGQTASRHIRTHCSCSIKPGRSIVAFFNEMNAKLVFLICKERNRSEFFGKPPASLCSILP